MGVALSPLESLRETLMHRGVQLCVCFEPAALAADVGTPKGTAPCHVRTAAGTVSVWPKEGSPWDTRAKPEGPRLPFCAFYRCDRVLPRCPSPPHVDQLPSLGRRFPPRLCGVVLGTDPPAADQADRCWPLGGTWASAFSLLLGGSVLLLAYCSVCVLSPPGPCKYRKAPSPR